MQDRAAIVRGARTPCGQRALRGVDRAVRVGAAAERHVLDDLFGSRIDHVPPPAALGLDPRAIDQLLRRNHRVASTCAIASPTTASPSSSCSSEIVSGGMNRMQFEYSPARISTTPLATARLIAASA